MKKRILSIALIVAMVVAMIPATLISASAAQYSGSYNGYDVYVSETELTVDGVKDAVYDNSENVISAQITTAGASFESWIVATATGFYFYADVKDATIDVDYEKGLGMNKADKTQLYFQLANKVLAEDGKTVTATEWAYDYIEADYAHEKPSVPYDIKAENVTKASKIVDGGYTMEYFVKWEDCSSKFTGPVSLNTVTLYFGVQVNSYGGDTGETNKGLAYDNPKCNGYWNDNYKSGTPSQPANLMIKANFITAPKASTTATNSYKSFITDETITVDGVKDDVYGLSQTLTPGYVLTGTLGKDIDYSANMVSTADGLYLYASILDNTLDKAEAVAGGLRATDGDKFQMYILIGNYSWYRWGYIDFDYVDGGRANVTQMTGLTAANYANIQTKTVFWDNGQGWDLEAYIPYNISPDFQANSIKNLDVKVGFQATNETCTAWDKNGSATARNRYGLCYDIPATGSAWTSSGYKNLTPVDFTWNPYTADDGVRLTYTPSITVDGVKDAGYGGDNVAYTLGITSNKCSTHTQKATIKAWTTVTDTKVVTYCEITDPTGSEGLATANDNVIMYLKFPLTGTVTSVGWGYLRSGHTCGASRWSAGADKPFLSTNGYEISGTGCGEAYARTQINDNTWGLEIAMDLPLAERHALANGEDVQIAVDLLHTDSCGDAGTTTCATSQTAYNWYWSPSSAAQAGYTRPVFTVNKTMTAANMAVANEIKGASVALGESITVNYYATVSAAVSNPVMKFTMNGKDTVVYGVPTNDNMTEYKFAFTGIAPQCMGDNIAAELYTGETLLASYAEYSVLQNLNNVKNFDNANLIHALLNYGAAAQKYVGYKTEALVNAGVVAPVYETIVNSDRVIGAENVAGARFSAAGVYHANANKIYAKVTTADASALTVTINGKAAELEKYADGTYIVYTDDIKVTGFDTVYTFVLSDGTNSQTLTYSVNAYCAAKQNAANAATAELAKAMYAYGMAAEAYAG